MNNMLVFKFNGASETINPYELNQLSSMMEYPTIVDKTFLVERDGETIELRLTFDNHAALKLWVESVMPDQYVPFATLY